MFNIKSINGSSELCDKEKGNICLGSYFIPVVEEGFEKYWAREQRALFITLSRNRYLTGFEINTVKAEGNQFTHSHTGAIESNNHTVVRPVILPIGGDDF